jgi:uncharacterized protein (DUF4415 family)
MMPPKVYAELTRHRGPQKAPTKTQITLRVDSDVAAKLRDSGQGWQTRANVILRRAVGL